MASSISDAANQKKKKKKKGFLTKNPVSVCTANEWKLNLNVKFVIWSTMLHFVLIDFWEKYCASLKPVRHLRRFTWLQKFIGVKNLGFQVLLVHSIAHRLIFLYQIYTDMSTWTERTIFFFPVFSAQTFFKISFHVT